MSNRTDLRERTKTTSLHGNRRGQIANFQSSFETINWLYLLFKCGIKTKTHFEWLLWHWFSLGQLNLEPTRPNGLVGCKVPTDLVKISVKEATHMGFYYIVLWVYRDNESALVLIMFCLKMGRKSLSKPILINFADTCIDGSTHWGLVTPYGYRDLGHHWLR